MASNPKYAELPGFAHDQPDIYETDDVPDSDQGFTSQDDSEAVEILHISSKDAYGKFKDCRLDGSKADFTDSISSKRKTGFDVTCGEWVLNDDKENESLPERYHRIKTEVKQFLEDVTAIEAEKRPDNHEVLLADMEMLEKLLADVNLEATIGETNADKSGETAKRLLNQLSSLKQPSQTENTKAAADSKTGALTYELFYKPEYSKLQQEQQVAALEKRLRALESMVGDDRSKVSALSAHTAGKSLQDICDDLTAKFYLLDATNIERVESQLSGLQERFLVVSERKQILEDAQKTEKITQMYDVARKVDHLLPGLSNVLQTLSSLQELHDHALQFSKCLTTLENQQNIINTQMKDDEELISKLQNRIDTDVKMIVDNISKVEVRMEAFKK